MDIVIEIRRISSSHSLFRLLRWGILRRYTSLRHTASALTFVALSLVAFATRPDVSYAADSGASATDTIAAPVSGVEAYINTARINAIIFVLLFSAVILYYTRRAQRGKKLFVRKIPGLEAVEEAVGRATEMGRAVLFIPGIQELDEIQTIAGVTILGRVARITAEYDTPLMVPVRYPLVFAGAQEMVQQSYTEVGRKDSFNKDMVRYVAGEQFAFAAHVNGWMMREKPAACVYMGGFFAESLLLAETGFASGAIQIAGTAEVAQLPFFVTACDYTLLGEELYAASAYLSHEPLLLGGLKGQDLIKIFLISAIIVGTIVVTMWPDDGGSFMRKIWESV